MKVLVISAAFPPMRAGEADHALHLCSRLASAGLDVHVLTTKGASVSVDPGVVLDPIMTSWSWRELTKLRNVIKRFAPDAVLLIYSGWVYQDHPMITFAPTLTKKILPDVRFVTQFEIEQGARMDNASYLSRAIRRAIKQWTGPVDSDWEFGTLLRDSDTVVVLSDNHRTKVAELLPQLNHKTLLLPPPPIMHLSVESNGETRKLCRSELGIKPEEFLLAYFGYVHPNKGIDVVLRALAIVSQRRADVRLLIIGGTEDDHTQREGNYAKEMSDLADELGIKEKIVWVGKYDADSDYASVCLRSADACVLAYDNGVSLNRSSFAASVAHGLPTITTRGDYLEPQFVDRNNVLLCPPQNPEALADRIDELIRDPAMRKKLHDGALKLSDEWFSWERTVELTIAALKGTVNNSNSSSGNSVLQSQA